ncbi:MAG: molybdenum ABC transporter ATP-binding protein [Alphaproteobacteria bacterium]|nr:molybdenum ABC transporter ATP-binding protein [Alphaproteobacteria bacterium]
MAFKVTVRVRYPDFLLDVDLAIAERGVTVIFGPSGSGKTSLLRTIAGLNDTAQGQITFQDQVWQSERIFLPPHRRPIGYIFQESSLFDHMNVRQNLAYGRKRTRDPMTLSEQQHIIDLLGISHLLDRHCGQLSGGERQRVAIGRALFLKPEILLMDEPMAALDFARKREILTLLEQLKADLKIPLLYVSHNIDDVTRLADHMVILAAGKVTRHGPVEQILSSHKMLNSLCDEPFSLLFGQVITPETRHHLTEVSIGDAIIRMPRQKVKKHQEIRLHIHARDVSLTLIRPTQTSVLNILDCHILSIKDPTPDGQCLIELGLHNISIQARISAYSCVQLNLAPGQRVFAQIKAVSLVQ